MMDNDERALRSSLIRLAHTKPEFRRELLPLLKEAVTVGHAAQLAHDFFERMRDTPEISSKEEALKIVDLAKKYVEQKWTWGKKAAKAKF
jgi:hypothetical protein